MPYTPNPQHRNNAFAHKKSQWSIGLAEEQSCYTLSTAQLWSSGNDFYGLHLAPTPTQLGVTPLPEAVPVKIAKFVGDHQGNWHGYPVAHWLSPFDKPHSSILKSWLDLGYISMPSMSRIHRGKKCSL